MLTIIANAKKSTFQPNPLDIDSAIEQAAYASNIALSQCYSMTMPTRGSRESYTFAVATFNAGEGFLHLHFTDQKWKLTFDYYGKSGDPNLLYSKLRNKFGGLVDATMIQREDV